MTYRILITPLFILFACSLYAQDAELPYRVIPDYPSQYTPGTVAARIVDGVGFRYYWATEGLRDEDLKFKPSEDGRTTEETLYHIYTLSLNIVNTTNNKPTVSEEIKTDLTFVDLRKETLKNLEAASENLMTSESLEDLALTFKSARSSFEFPFWNLLNGPIADALWHIGQVVSHRRTSGNPFNSNASVLTGTFKE